MHTTVLSLQNELERARERLKGVEENIKKSIGRDINIAPGLVRPGFKRGGRQLDEDGNILPGKDRKVFLANSDLGKNRFGRNTEPWAPGVENRSREHDFRVRGARRTNNFGSNFTASRVRSDEKDPEERISVKKRLGEPQAITVFSRLSGPPKDEEFEEAGVKMTSQVIVQDAPTRKDVLAAQSGDKSSKDRNKRMFGALLGTLQKFRQEENKLKEKEEKRANVERKLEEAAAREKEEAKRARQELFTSRRKQQLEIRHLEYKLLHIKQLNEWESTKLQLKNFIQTKTTPKIFYLPKTHNSHTQELLAATRSAITKMVEDKRAEVEKAIAEHMPELPADTELGKKNTETLERSEVIAIKEEKLDDEESTQEERTIKDRKNDCNEEVTCDVKQESSVEGMDQKNDGDSEEDKMDTGAE